VCILNKAQLILRNKHREKVSVCTHAFFFQNIIYVPRMHQILTDICFMEELKRHEQLGRRAGLDESVRKHFLPPSFSFLARACSLSLTSSLTLSLSLALTRFRSLSLSLSLCYTMTGDAKMRVERNVVVVTSLFWNDCLTTALNLAMPQPHVCRQEGRVDCQQHPGTW